MCKFKGQVFSQQISCVKELPSQSGKIESQLIMLLDDVFGLPMPCIDLKGF